MTDDKNLLDWLDYEAPVTVKREGNSVIVADADTGREMGRGLTVREAIWQAMRGDAV